MGVGGVSYLHVILWWKNQVRIIYSISHYKCNFYQFLKFVIDDCEVPYTISPCKEKTSSLTQSIFLEMHASQDQRNKIHNVTLTRLKWTICITLIVMYCSALDFCIIPATLTDNCCTIASPSRYRQLRSLYCK